MIITEATCVDEEFTASHETDVDCGGQYCLPCSHGKVTTLSILTLYRYRWDGWREGGRERLTLCSGTDGGREGGKG